ncbi:transposase [Mycobacterium dioxanotrophicus]|uniref:transposase n=1 Tax=Mycobacterium dioxanotrophicus TaxID=482462 RepID=UPI0038CBF4F7
MLAQALAALPAAWRPDPGLAIIPTSPRCWCAATPPEPPTPSPTPAGPPGGVLLRLPVDWRVQDAVDTLNLAEGWYPAIGTAGGLRDGAWIAEATTLVNLSSWPPGTRLILRKERPHPGAQLRFTDADGMRITAFITDTPPGVVSGQVAGLELRHRQHARVEDRIRELKATGLRNLPCHSFWANAAWLEIALTAADLVTWCRLIGFRTHPGLARTEIATFRYRVLHVAARITRSARQTCLRLDATWRWAAQIATAWQHIRTAFD